MPDWQLGRESPFRTTGSYRVTADARDAGGCLLASGQTADIDLQGVNAPGVDLELPMGRAATPRVDAWCATPARLVCLDLFDWRRAHRLIMIVY